jgi:hypothetical protein
MDFKKALDMVKEELTRQDEFKETLGTEIPDCIGFYRDTNGTINLQIFSEDAIKRIADDNESVATLSKRESSDLYPYSTRVSIDGLTLFYISDVAPTWATEGNCEQA